MVKRGEVEMGMFRGGKLWRDGEDRSHTRLPYPKER